MQKKILLVILDGWGIPKNQTSSAINKAHTPFINSLYENYPHSKLEASGTAVGLPEGQMGNSEVGHMNIGAGRIVYQDLVRINKAIKEKELDKNTVLMDAFKYAKEKKCKVHFIGLVSDGGVHSHIEHLKSLCDIAKDNEVENLCIHAFTDGRDTDPMSGLGFIKELEAHLKKSTGKIASLIGRYFAMDRDNRWERVKSAYDLMTKGKGKSSTDILQSIQESYDEGITDEFIKPIVCVDKDSKPIGLIEEDDVVLCFNFRTDRGREITQALYLKDYPEQEMKHLPLYYMTLTNYDDDFKTVKNIFDKDNLKNTLGEVIADAGKKQIRIAETEKYPHVTFFFSGGREAPFEGEKRLLCPSPKVATYDLKPEMSAEDITDTILPEIKKQEADFICLNFANADMVGHSGVFDAVVKACETVDKCAKKVIEAALANNYTSLIIADHGNAEYMINKDGSPNTAHTTNLVPFIIADEKKDYEMKDGRLADLAPTILFLMGLTIPKEMMGEILVK